MRYLLLALFIVQILGRTWNIHVTDDGQNAGWFLTIDSNPQLTQKNPTITVAVGDTINWEVDLTGGFHPFSVSMSSNPTVFLTGTSPNPQVVPSFQAAGGAKFTSGTNGGTATMTLNTAGTVFYVCQVHPQMIGNIIVTGSVVPSPTPITPNPVPTPTPKPTPITPNPVPTPNPNTGTICSRYATAKGWTHRQLIENIVDNVLARELGVEIVRVYFNGVKPPNSINFTHPTQGAAYTRLRTGLVNFFGEKIGCTGITWVASGRTMRSIHANMQVSAASFTEFVERFDFVLNEMGVSATDRSTIRSVLEGTRTEIVDNSICARYSQGPRETETGFMARVIDEVLENVFADPNTRQYFNGDQPEGSTDYTGNSAASTSSRSVLRAHLINYFAKSERFGCTERQTYTGREDMELVHRNMGITTDDFNSFVSRYVQALQEIGFSSADQALIRTHLEGFQEQIVTSAPVPMVALGLLLSVLVTSFF